MFDDFIGICQVTLLDDLQYIIQSLLYRIESIFLDRISILKLTKEGVQETKKEILDYFL